METLRHVHLRNFIEVNTEYCDFNRNCRYEYFLFSAMRLVVQNKDYISFFFVIVYELQYHSREHGILRYSLRKLEQKTYVYPTRQTSLFSTSGIFDLSEEIVSRNFCARETP